MNVRDTVIKADWPPENTVFRVHGLHLGIDIEGVHPFHARHEQAALANWQMETDRNPALYNGDMVFQRDVSIVNGVIRAHGFLVSYSTFLWWRRQNDPDEGYHLFGFGVIVSSDGALIAIRMAPHTANPGMVYCAAGSLDRLDICGNRCDLDANIAREIREETGLDVKDALPDREYYALHSKRRITVFRFIRFGLQAAELVEHIHAHMAADEEKEIDAVIVIRSSDPAAYPYSEPMLPIIDFFFKGDPEAPR